MGHGKYGLKDKLLRIMKNRRSIRKFSKKPVSLETICRILEAGRLAPSGANMQPWIYVVVTDDELKEKIREEAEKVERDYHRNAPDQLRRWLNEQRITPEKSFLTEAPVLIVVAGLIKAPYWFESTWISIAYLLLSIETHNLGTTTYTPVEMGFLNKLLDIPHDYCPVVIMPIGESLEKPSYENLARKPLEKVIHLNRYGNRKNI